MADGIRLPPEDDDKAPFLGSWNTIYLAICVWAVVCMAMIAVFVRWRF